MALEIIVASARRLTRIDPTPNTKIYVVVSITGDAVKEQISAKTDVDRHGGGNPTWNFPVKFDVEGLKQDLKARIVFALKCEDEKGHKDLGEVHVSVAELLKSAEDGNSMGSYAAVSYPVRDPSGESVALLNFQYKFGGSPMNDAPAAGFATSRSMGVYPPQGYNHPPPPPATGYGGYPPPPATGYGGYPPPPAAGHGGYPPPPPPSLQSSDPYPSPSPSHYTPLQYPPYKVGPLAAAPPPSHYTSTPAYPPYNVGQSAAPPSHYMPPSLYPPYNVGPSAAPPHAHSYPPHPSHVQARAAPVEQRSVPKKKKSVWGSALGVAGAVAVGVFSGVASSSSLELPSAPAPEFSDLTAGFQIPDPSGYAPQDLSFINTFPDPSAIRDATYVDYIPLSNLLLLKDFKNMLKHKTKEFSLESLITWLRIEKEARSRTRGRR
ncbi:protein SRC2-like [Benincasa hispida]|uniref:protein SRC2-like n=1 Tax=Benincasa hispida TaxID=102211 RepID=UPI0019003018|nr:protein SRC2-like [Benincasa hispida]